MGMVLFTFLEIMSKPRDLRGAVKLLLMYCVVLYRGSSGTATLALTQCWLGI